MNLFVDRLNRVQTEAGAAVGIVHHTGKDASRGARGSNSLLGAVDAEISIERSGEFLTATVENLKAYADPPPMQIHTRLVRLSNGHSNLALDYLGEPKARVEATTHAAATILKLLADLEEPLSPAEVRRMSGLSEQTTRRTLKALTDKGQLGRHGTPTRPRYLVPATEPSNLS